MAPVLVNRKELCEAFDFVKNIVPAKPIIAADGNIIIKVEGSNLILSASDGAQGARAVVSIQNNSENPDAFHVGCDPKRFGKSIAKDSAESLFLEKVSNTLKVSDPQESEDKYITLVLGNIKRASVISNWIPAEPMNTVEMNTAFFSEVVSFLDNFTPDGNHEVVGKHDVLVFSKNLVHTTNGVHLRGICASKAFIFSSDVSIHKRYATPLAKSIANLKSSTVFFRDSLRFVSVASPDEKFALIVPTLRKQPPVAPLEYLSAQGEPSFLDYRDVIKGLDRLTTSNYNGLNTLVGVDIKISGAGEDSRMQLILDDGKASQTFSLKRNGSDPVEKVTDVSTFLMLLKTFSKGCSPKVFFGEEDTRYLRFVDVRTVGDVSAAFIAVSAYARKA